MKLKTRYKVKYYVQILFRYKKVILKTAVLKSIAFFFLHQGFLILTTPASILRSERGH